jgi:molybdopterin-guanine dinucleotide biosynthesis protein A
MGGVDKGLQLLRGRPMVAWVIERLAPQVDEILINANQNTAAYAGFGYRVIPDEISGFAGPLAGLQRGLAEAAHELVATVPCDSPFLPRDLMARLRGALEREAAEIAVAKTGDQPHPVFCLCRKAVLGGLTAFLSGGGRKIDAWYSRLRLVEVQFDDQPGAFSNVNTAAELRAFEEGPLP